jgi:hypothetical protein
MCERMHRLGEHFEFVTPRKCILKQSARVVVPGDEQDLTFGKELADLNRGLNAVHLRHHDTCHKEFELKAPSKFDARASPKLHPSEKLKDAPIS